MAKLCFCIIVIIILILGLKTYLQSELMENPSYSYTNNFSSIGFCLGLHICLTFTKEHEDTTHDDVCLHEFAMA